MAHLLRISKRDILTEAQMQLKRCDVSYHIVAIDQIMKTNPETIVECFGHLAHWKTSALKLPVTLVWC